MLILLCSSCSSLRKYESFNIRSTSCSRLETSISLRANGDRVKVSIPEGDVHIYLSTRNSFALIGPILLPFIPFYFGNSEKLSLSISADLKSPVVANLVNWKVLVNGTTYLPTAASAGYGNEVTKQRLPEVLLKDGHTDLWIEFQKTDKPTVESEVVILSVDSLISQKPTQLSFKTMQGWSYAPIAAPDLDNPKPNPYLCKIP